MPQEKMGVPTSENNVRKEIGEGFQEHADEAIENEVEIPRINSEEEMFQFLSDPRYSHNRDEGGLDIREAQKGTEGDYVFSVGIGSGAIKSNATEEQLRQWYNKFYERADNQR